ncbi:ATP-binding cassette domain-containing protein [Bacillaceae bacterium SIJ1]|uniref:iron ABC transporter ATP-binding protein n=1 Tax=Litoribacterium kuwaitense TaxID=1398745 RepID=UPI0013EA84F2|nr:ATP-binding cassette domain-containing protein [Litoribacterium kuwaitense]NGP44595.1 ATP-binding cassette domain-containing protein [Litoribacterium kuwaitense]
MVEVEQVTKSYGSSPVVSDVTFRVEKGTLTSLIGPNGAGKSTLLSMMTRLSPIDQGHVFIDGKDVSRWKSQELAKKVSILKQTNHINLRLTVRELVAFGRFPYSQGRLTKADEETIDEALQYVELEEMQTKYVDELSGGQRQRAFIAMVIAQNTDYIFLDEPLNNLDMKYSVQTMKLLTRLVRELGKTVILVIHDINFASSYSDTIVAMKDGKLMAEGPTREMIRSDVLHRVFDMHIPVHEVECQKVCLYF